MNGSYHKIYVGNEVLLSIELTFTMPYIIKKWPMKLNQLSLETNFVLSMSIHYTKCMLCSVCIG